MINKNSTGRFCFGLLVVSICCLSAGAQDREFVEAPVVNHAQSVKVVGLFRQRSTEGDNSYVLVMQNTSSQSITSYSIEYETGSIGYAGKTIPPQAKFESQVGSTKELKICYVVLEDGSVDGQEISPKAIQVSEGEWEQYERIEKLLVRATENQDVEWLLAEVRKLPEEDERKSHLFNLGLMRAKHDAALQVRRLDKDKLPTELVRVQAETAKTMTRLRRLLKKP